MSYNIEEWEKENNSSKPKVRWLLYYFSFKFLVNEQIIKFFSCLTFLIWKIYG